MVVNAFKELGRKCCQVKAISIEGLPLYLEDLLNNIIIIVVNLIAQLQVAPPRTEEGLLLSVFAST